VSPNITADARSATLTRSFRFDSELSKILDEEAERMGVSVNALVGIIIKLGETVPVDTIMFWKKELTEHSVLEYIEKIICRYGHLGTYDEVSQSNSRIIVIRHRLGRKGSKFFEGYLRSTLKNTIGKDAIFEVTDSSVKFEIKNHN
jgi:hypothetical protein